jgi:hypothetical protein
LTVAPLQGNLVKSVKTLVPRSGKMYRKVDSPSTQPEEFELPFEGKLSEDNRWVIIANLIPWSSFEACIRQKFCGGDGGTRAAISDGIEGINNQRKIRNK